jgi:hypothetical protein
MHYTVLTLGTKEQDMPKIDIDNGESAKGLDLRYATRRAAFVLALSALSSIGGHADEATGSTTPTTRFDGLWQTTLSCTNSNGALGYSFRFASTVKNGLLHGEKGVAHEAGWLQVDGQLRADGMADLYVEGLVGAAPFAVGQRPAGTPYGYHVEAQFSLDRAEGHRVEGRPCVVVWTRENDPDRLRTPQ